MNELFSLNDRVWDDEDLKFNCVDDSGDINFYCRDCDDEIYLTKSDVIAMAKHFKLTEEDLNE